MTTEYEDSISEGANILKFRCSIFYPSADARANDLPEKEYILIDWLESIPQGSCLLRRHSHQMIDRIRSKFGEDRKIILQAANGETQNTEAQKKLEDYYQACGFEFLSTSPRQFWMNWK